MARVVKPSLDEKVTASRELRNQFAGFAGKLKGFRPAPEVLTEVQGVRTIFLDVDRITKINAWPIERVALVHGESNHGKTEFCLGLGKSFLEQGHAFAFLDAEHTTPKRWLRDLSIPVEHPGFTAMRPKSYEDAVSAVTEWAESIAEARAKGELDRDTTGICVVDSISKLVPKELRAVMFDADTQEIEKASAKKGKPKRGIDGMGGRAAQYKAALNNAWMNILVPLMSATRCAMVIITREHEDPDAGLFGEGFKVGGGRALVYDSSLVVRISRDAAIVDEAKTLLGERHCVQIRKTKIGAKDERTPRAFFHTSNGKSGVPIGFDPYRDMIDVGVKLGAIEQNGAFYSFEGERIGQGIAKASAALYKQPERYERIHQTVRGLIDDANEKGVESFGEPVE